MKRISKILAGTLTGLCLITPLSRASDEPLFTAKLWPARSHWVPMGTPLRLELLGATPQQMAHLDLTTLRLHLDGKEITGAFLALAGATGGIKLEPTQGRATVQVTIPLTPGKHHWRLVCRPRQGFGRLRWAADFTVFQPERAIPLKQRLVDQPAATVIKVEDFIPPTITATPADLAFLHTNQPRLDIRWTDALTWVDPATAKILLNNQDITANFTCNNVGAYYDIPPTTPLPGGKNVLVASVKDGLGNLAVTTATFNVVDNSHRSPWPFKPTNQPGIIGHTHHQFQNYGSATTSAYFHHGVDIMPAAQSPIHACRGGKVVTLYWYGGQPYYFEVGIQDSDGFIWQYHHVDQPTVPQAIKTAFAQKTPIAAGTHIGDIVFWPASSYNKKFHHTHLNILDADGRYVNPLHLMLQQGDKVKPTIAEILFAKNGTNNALNTPLGPRPVLSGNIDIIARAEDKDGLDVYQLTPFSMEWSLAELGGPQSHNLPFIPLWLFNSLPGGSDRYKHVHTVFQHQISFGSQTYYTRGNYNSRSFWYNLTNTRQGFPDPSGGWNTAARDIWGLPLFPNGLYRIAIRATDDRGNQTTKTIDVEVKN